MDEQPSDWYVAEAAREFLRASHRHTGEDLRSAQSLIEGFVFRFWPVLRHYRAAIVGGCLALAYDAPELVDSTLHGFGMDMKAGCHPQDREGALGTFRDDGAYLALQAHDYFEWMPR